MKTIFSPDELIGVIKYSFLQYGKLKQIPHIRFKVSDSGSSYNLICDINESISITSNDVEIDKEMTSSELNSVISIFPALIISQLK